MSAVSFAVLSFIFVCSLIILLIVVSFIGGSSINRQTQTQNQVGSSPSNSNGPTALSTSGVSSGPSRTITGLQFESPKGQPFTVPQITTPGIFKSIPDKAGEFKRSQNWFGGNISPISTLRAHGVVNFVFVAIKNDCPNPRQVHNKVPTLTVDDVPNIVKEYSAALPVATNGHMTMGKHEITELNLSCENKFGRFDGKMDDLYGLDALIKESLNKKDYEFKSWTGNICMVYFMSELKIYTWAGMAVRNIWKNDDTNRSFIFLNGSATGTFLHEFGHTCGLRHGNRVESAGAAPIIYGDRSCSMGNSPLLRFGAASAYLAGWLDKPTYVEIETGEGISGTYTLKNDSTEAHILTIPLIASKGQVYSPVVHFPIMFLSCRNSDKGDNKTLVVYVHTLNNNEWMSKTPHSIFEPEVTLVATLVPNNNKYTFNMSNVRTLPYCIKYDGNIGSKSFADTRLETALGIPSGRHRSVPSNITIELISIDKSTNSASVKVYS